MVVCYRKETCEVKNTGACQAIFCRDACPRTKLGINDEEREMDSEAGADEEIREETAKEM